MPVSASDCGLDHHDVVLESGQRAELGAAMAMALNNSPMPCAPLAISRDNALSISAALSRRRCAFSAAARFSMPRRRRNVALPNRAVDARAHAFGALRQRLEIDVRGEVGLARRAQRIGEGMPGDRLQCFAQAVSGVAVVDDQRRAVCRARAVRVRARYCRRAIRRSRRSGALRASRAACVASKCGSGSRAVPMASLPSAPMSIDALVPAVGLFDRLVHRQRVEELVGDDDAGPAGHVVERRVPQHRHAEVVQPPLLHCCSAGLISTRCSTIAARKPARPSPRATRRASACRGRVRARRCARFPARPSAARPPPSTARSVRRTSG